MENKDWNEKTAWQVTMKIAKMKMDQGKEIHSKVAKYKLALSETPSKEHMGKIRGWDNSNK